jgi:hypothetical protein
MTNKSIIVVLGMHRSGTSCLTGCLEEAGLYLGDVVTYAPFNKKGNRENKALYLLHEKVLSSHGGSWDNPKIVNSWLPEHIEELREIVDGYSGLQQWGFKDPRALFTLQGWLDLLPDTNFTFIASLRHPAKVAASLTHRNKFTQNQGFDLWEKYNQQLLSLMDRFPVQLVNFDLEEQAYKHKLQSIFPTILNSQLEFDDGLFYDKVLINQSEIDELPLKIETLYQKLLAFT